MTCWKKIFFVICNFILYSCVIYIRSMFGMYAAIAQKLWLFTFIIYRILIDRSISFVTKCLFSTFRSNFLRNRTCSCSIRRLIRYCYCTRRECLCCLYGKQIKLEWICAMSIFFHNVASFLALQGYFEDMSFQQILGYVRKAENKRSSDFKIVYDTCCNIMPQIISWADVGVPYMYGGNTATRT